MGWTHRQRLRGTSPRDGVRVCATQVAGARSGIRRDVKRELERRNLRLAAEVARQQLIHRHLCDDLHLVSSAARRTGQKRPRSPGVDVVPGRIEPREHKQLVAERRERFEDRRELERAALSFAAQYSMAIPLGT